MNPFDIAREIAVEFEVYIADMELSMDQTSSSLCVTVRRGTVRLIRERFTESLCKRLPFHNVTVTSR